MFFQKFFVWATMTSAIATASTYFYMTHPEISGRLITCPLGAPSGQVCYQNPDVLWFSILITEIVLTIGFLLNTIFFAVRNRTGNVVLNKRQQSSTFDMSSGVGDPSTGSG